MSKLREPMFVDHPGGRQWRWVKCVGHWADGKDRAYLVNPDTFASLAHDIHLHGGEKDGCEIHYPTRNAALRAGAYAGLLVPDWTFDPE